MLRLILFDLGRLFVFLPRLRTFVRLFPLGGFQLGSFLLQLINAGQSAFAFAPSRHLQRLCSILLENDEIRVRFRISPNLPLI